MTENITNKKMKMVEWYSPSQLKDTGIKTLISTIIGENADPRLITAANDKAFFDYSHGLKNDGLDFTSNETERNEIWVDYVSDVGDGWNSTYSVAYSLARESIEADNKTLKRGEVLIFGGDGVYPTANTEEYEQRLVNPYRTAFETVGKANANAQNLEKEPHVFALPGNHDWYDSLVAFQKLFCTHIFNRRMFAGGWRTRQKRSYFTLKLPHNWWLIGVDLQLSHNIDVPQLQYFESIVNLVMEKGDKVILCLPEPYWVKALKYEGLTDKFVEKEESIEKLENIFEKNGVEVKLYLAGDLHHYRRFETEDGQQQKITAGGGGAFLHPTHDFDCRDITYKSKAKDARRFFWRRNYPEFDDSRKMDWTNLYGFIFKNKTFGILTGVLYALLAFLTHGVVKGDFTLMKAFEATVSRCIEQPLALIVVGVMLVGLVFFTDSNSKIYRRTAGFIHGLSHLMAIFFLGWLGFLLMRFIIGAANFNNHAYRIEHEAYINVVWLICILVVCGIGGYIIGSIIMGVYLFISLHLFGRHDNETFSAMKIEDYKNFLRLHITKDNLTIYPFKIEKVAKEWICEGKGEKQICNPKGELNPELIEEPIKLN